MKNIKIIFLVTLGFLISSNANLFCMKNNSNNLEAQAWQDNEDGENYLENLMGSLDAGYWSQDSSKPEIRQEQAIEFRVISRKEQILIELGEIIEKPKLSFLESFNEILKPCKNFLYRKFLSLCKENKNIKTKNNFSCRTCIALTILTACNGYPAIGDCCSYKNK